MSDLEKEKAIISESPDFETQREILNEEKINQKKLRKFYTHIGCVFFLMFMIIIIAYLTIDIYKEYNFFSNDVCLNVNINEEGLDFKTINVADNNICAPEYNIDYFNNRKATFNIDLFGNQSKIYNPRNQKDGNGYCLLNCDSNNDNWPDYNIDLNGDGIADINIIHDYNNSNVCDLNCDLNNDTIPDTNIDTNGDGNADVNITDEYDSSKPLYNVDYKGNRRAEFNVRNEDGSISNPVTKVTPGAECTENCDLDGDGWPDYNIKLPETGITLNELVTTGSKSVDYDRAKTVDWKCFISGTLPSCDTNNVAPNNRYINIDVDGDGTPDVNVSYNGGATTTNGLNIAGSSNGQNITLNEDFNDDGFPDFNIDLNGDGIPDLNITAVGSHECTKNCDTNFDGKADYLIDYDGTGNNSISITNGNLDVDFDSKCDVNCDTNYDLYPDLNIDLDSDGAPDLNIDLDDDGIPDINIDTDNDHKADSNMSARLDGNCNFNCVDKPETYINYTESCTTNCDTDNDGWPDTNVDLDYDGVCDINCENGQTNVDKNKDYYVDTEDKAKEITFDKGKKDIFFILNPVDIKGVDIEPGWQDTYVLEVYNNAPYAASYKVEWTDIINEFTEENNLYYDIRKNGRSYLMDMRTPYKNTAISDEIILRPKAKVRYVLNMRFLETNENQNVDSGKAFRGKLIVTLNK